MFRTFSFILILLVPTNSFGWDSTPALDDAVTKWTSPFPGGKPPSSDLISRDQGDDSDWLSQRPSSLRDFNGMIIRGQDEGESGGGDSNDPTAPSCNYGSKICSAPNRSMRAATQTSSFCSLSFH
ncbi:MAG: hypothetical protein ABGX16_17175 [Pirellulales bacterium]